MIDAGSLALRPGTLARKRILVTGGESGVGQLIAVDGAGYQGNGANFAALTAWTGDDWAAARAKIRNADAHDKAMRTTKMQEYT
jgi:NAD(P)-dependent dehydrogenase (short-subunit alcohol dehydrogenase family)